MKKISQAQIIAIGTLFILSGLIIFSSQYFLNKKNELFEYINMKLYFDQIVDDPQPVDPDVVDPDLGDPDAPDAPDAPAITESYIAILEIPKIDLKKGIYKMESKYNKVSRNIAILSPSDYPDVVNGNFVLAAHSGTGYLSFFRYLYKLNTGDMAYVYYDNYKYTYEITYIYTQQKTGTINVYRPYNKSTLMLITCTKNDESTQTVYVAELIKKEPSS